MISTIIGEVNSLKIDSRALRRFGITFFVVLVIIAGYLYWKEHSSWRWFGGGGAVFLALGLFFPYLLKYVYKVWMGLAILLGWIMTRLVVTLTFFLLFVPMGFLLRILGKDILDKKVNKRASTYWCKHETVSDKSRYLKQY